MNEAVNEFRRRSMLSNIKKPISVLLAFAIAVIPLSCKSLDPKLLEQTATFDKGVTPMRVVINTDSIKACFPGGWEHEMIYCCSYNFQQNIQKILRQNLMFKNDSRNIYLSVLVRNVEFKTNPAWYGVAVLVSVGFIMLFGFPYYSFTSTINLEAAVMRSDGKVLKTYTSTVSDKEYSAMYWGYSAPYKTAFIKSLIAGCADLRKQIEADRENINKLIR